MAKAFAKAKSQGRGKTCISAGVKAKAAFSGRSRVVKKHAPASGQRVGDKAKAEAPRAKASTTAKDPPTLRATGKGKAHAAPLELRPERKAKAQAKAMPAASLKVAAKTAKTKATATGSTNGKAKVAATALANRLRGKTRAAALGKVKARPRVRPRIRRDALAAMVHDILWDLLSEGPVRHARAKAASHRSQQTKSRAQANSDSDSLRSDDSPEFPAALGKFWTEAPP